MVDLAFGKTLIIRLKNGWVTVSGNSFQPTTATKKNQPQNTICNTFWSHGYLCDAMHRQCQWMSRLANGL